MIWLNSNKGSGVLPGPLLKSVDWNDARQLNSYSMLSANLFNFMPQLDLKHHFDFYFKFREQQVFNGDDIRQFEGDYALPIYGWDPLLEGLRNQNGIIATYHFGPFQLINYLLIKSEIPYALLVGAETIAVWHQRYPTLMQVMERARLNNTFQLIVANESNSLRKMYRLLEEGYSLLIYVDGLEGLDIARERQIAPVHFLGQQIVVPKGAALLANYFQIPIYPVLLRRTKEAVHVEHDFPILSDKIMDKDRFVQTSMSRLYSFLSTYVTHWPEQWTLWTTLHQFLQREKPLGNRDYLASVALMQRYGLISTEDKGYLLDKSSYRLYPVKNDEFNCLKSNWLDFGVLSF